MSNAERKEFRSKLGEMIRRTTRPKPVEIASLAIDAGLPIHDTLEEIARIHQIRRANDSEAFVAVVEFIIKLCGNNSDCKTLEFTSATGVLMSVVLDGYRNAAECIIVDNTDLAEAYSVLFKDTHVVSSVEELDSGTLFDRIFCQPPIGNRLKKRHADGFGGEVVTILESHIVQNGQIFWLTARSALQSEHVGNTIDDLAERGLYVTAKLEVPAGALAGTNLEAVLIVMERRNLDKKMVGALRDREISTDIASALAKGPSQKSAASWTWLESNDPRSFSQIEREQRLKKLTPRGQSEQVLFNRLILEEKIERADKITNDQSKATAHIYVPEYTKSIVTARLDEQTVKHSAVYRVPIDTTLVNPHFLAMLLNSRFGRELRLLSSKGTAIPRISITKLKNILLPLPPLHTQDKIAKTENDLSMLNSNFNEMKNTLQSDWTLLPEIFGKVGSLKAVLSIEQKIENWWRELPYPLATIYRLCQVSKEPKDQFDCLLNFFEMAAVYLAAIGTSHVKVLRRDYKDQFKNWFQPGDAAGIKRTNFGFWIRLAGASLKDLSRIASDDVLRLAAIDVAGPELVDVASDLGPLRKTASIFDAVRQIRNLHKGHGGHMKNSDAVRLNKELQSYIRKFYEATFSIFRRLLLVKPDHAETNDHSYTYKIEILVGSDPTFEQDGVELSQRTKSNSLAFWMKNSPVMCRSLPFFRLGVPQDPEDSSFYVFNRVENGEFRWISYHKAREQEYFSPEEELGSLIDLVT